MRTNIKHGVQGWFAMVVLAMAQMASGQVRVVGEKAGKGVEGEAAFRLVGAGKCAAVDIRMASAPRVLEHAAGIFRADLAKVGGLAQESKHDGGKVLIGVLGDEQTDKLIAESKVDVSGLKGKWESYLIVVTGGQGKTEGKTSLLVIGSDARGAAYGLMDLLEQVGVSPWSWWADVPVTKRESVYVLVDQPVVEGPKVRYRGVFINDEDWGLLPWAKDHFEKENGSIGPKTYEKVFELMLRLKANTLWPAMHPVTKSFNAFRENPKLADEYGIVMGSSHCEPLLVNNAEEWSKEKNGKWEWETNRAGIMSFLAERVKENGEYENLWTIGMRGIHDAPLSGGEDVNGKTKRLEEIFAAERELLAPLGGGDASKVPQVFIPYKEVLEIYNNGLKVPDDVTLMWVDDNHGWIRRLPDQAERKRSGGSGVYYHLSYWGSPTSYLWLDTTPPAQVWEEMTKAAAYGCDRIWIVNVGDIKSTERGMEYFLRLAWNPYAPILADQASWLKAWAGKTFGAVQGDQIGQVLNEYYRLSWGNRPEHLGRSVAGDVLWDPATADQRMKECDDLYQQAVAIGQKLPPEMQDAYFELVLYPVSGMTGTMVKVLSARESRRVVNQDEQQAGRAADRAEAAWHRIVADTKWYNQDIAGGKWQGIVDNMSLPRYEEATSSLKSPIVARKSTNNQGPPPTNPSPNAPPAPAIAKVHLPVKDAKLEAGATGVGFQLLSGLGTDGVVAFIDPMKYAEESQKDPTTSARAQWRFNASLEGEVRVVINALPTHNPAGKPSAGGVKCAVRINDGPLEWVDFKFDQSGKDWARRVLTAKMSMGVQANIKPGPQVVTIYAAEGHVVLDSVDIYQP